MIAPPRHFGLTGLILTLLFAATTSSRADITGPDGVSYPDWTKAGVPGGIPTTLVQRAAITTGGDTALQLETAAKTAHDAGGGFVWIPTGTYTLTRPVLIPWDNVVLRGANWNNTKFIFTYAPPAANVAFYRPYGAGTTMYANNWIQAHADPVNLQSIEILAKVSGALDSTLQSCALAAMNSNWGATFSVSTNASTIITKTGTGSREIVARATYPGNVVKEVRLTLTLTSTNETNAIPQPSLLGAINFCGRASVSAHFELTADALRGQTTISVPSTSPIVVDQAIDLRAPRNPTWDAAVQNACTTSDTFRYYQFKVTNVMTSGTNKILTLNQPLRIDYPLDPTPLSASYTAKKNPFVVQIIPIRRCGVEAFSLEQTTNVWTSGVIFSNAWECWGKNVKITKAGRFPLYCSPAKWCEVRGCEMHDAWFKGGGGTAYVGWEVAYDCLMDSVTTSKLRHAPQVQWSASGNVIRNSKFTDSDAQWHSGWTNENLFENCTVTSNLGNGGYGYGMWASPPNDTNHGPNGPRNVVYNCDINSPLKGIVLGGQNRDWKIVNNRFATDDGEGIFAQMNSGGHLVKNNVFVMRHAKEGVWLNDANCTGVQLINNSFIGLPSSVEIADGLVNPLTETGNTTADLIVPLTFANNGFESANLSGWTADAMSALSTSAKRTGTYGVRVTDTVTNNGSSLLSPSFTVVGGRVYAGRCYSHWISGDLGGAGLYLRFFDAAGTEITSSIATLAQSSVWGLAEVSATAPAAAVTAKLWVHSYGANLVTFDVDDFSIGEVKFGVPNPGFELAAEDWSLSGDNGMSAVIAAAAQGGTKGLRVTDASATLGSSCASPTFVASAGKTYQVRFWSRRVSGAGIGVYLRYLNSVGGDLGSQLVDVPSSPDWKQYVARGDAPASTAFVQVWIHSYSTATVTADFDNFTLLELPSRPVTIDTPTSAASIFNWQRGILGNQ